MFTLIMCLTAIFIVVIINLRKCEGLSVSLSGSASYAVLDQAFQVTCTVTDDTSTEGFVTFSVSGSRQDCAVIVSSCTQFTPVEGYTCGCVSGQSRVYYLNITSVSLMDDGRWECRRLQNNDSMTLPVYYGPYNNLTLDKSSPQIVTEAVTPSLTVDCSATCTPCSYTWKKDTQTVSSSRTLSLTSITRNQAGDYICTAVNTATGVTSSAPTLTVTVYYAPGVNLEVEPAGCRPYRVYVGQQNVQLTCQVTAANPTETSYSWTRDGSSVPSATSSMYSLSPVTRGSAGNYTCAARNSVGTSSSPGISVDVQYPPTVSVPNSQSLVETQTLRVTCTVDSNPTATVTWSRKDGGSLPSQTGSTLTISNIQRSQAGVYVCTATITLSPCLGSSEQRSASDEVTVDVQYSPSMSGVPPTSPVTETTTLHINCSSYTVPGNPSTTSYRWTGPGYSSSGPLLTITSITRTASGVYNCTASNTLTPTGGQPHTGSAIGQFHVDVQYSSTITSFTINSETTKVNVSEAASVQLACRVDSNPPSSIHLLNGSTELKTADNALAVDHRWTADCRHRGNYTCTADNDLIAGGLVRKQVELLVTCAPRPDETYPKHTYASELGENITLSLMILSYPSPTITWSSTNITTQRNLTSSSSLTRVSDLTVTSTLTLTNLQQEDFRQYQVHVDNGVGQPVEYSLKLVAQGPPSPPTDVTVVAVSPSSLQASWKQGFNGGLQQTFRVEYSKDEVTWEDAGTYRETGQGKYLQANITNLPSQTAYYVRIVATNSMGSSDYTQSVRGLTKVKPTDPGPQYGLIGGVTGGGIAVLLLVVVVAVVLIRYKRKRGDDTERITNSLEKRRDDDRLEMRNDIYESADSDKPVMQDNLCYASSGEIGLINHGAEAGAVSDEYAVVGKTKPNNGPSASEVYSAVQKHGKQKGKKDGEKKDKGKKSADKGDEYENTTISEEGNPYINHAFDDQPEATAPEGAKAGRDEDGLLYVGIDFSNHNLSPHVHREEESTEYAGIQIGVVGPPPKDEDEKNESEGK